jgi:hypothetical protein
MLGEYKMPFLGEYRSQSAFLFKAKTINGITRRWERAVWEERYVKVTTLYHFSNDVANTSEQIESLAWLPTRWLDLQEKR